MDRQNFGSVGTLIRDIQRLHSHDSEYTGVNGGQAGGNSGQGGAMITSGRSGSD